MKLISLCFSLFLLAIAQDDLQITTEPEDYQEPARHEDTFTRREDMLFWSDSELEQHNILRMTNQMFD